MINISHIRACIVVQCSQSWHSVFHSCPSFCFKSVLRDLDSQPQWSPRDALLGRGVPLSLCPVPSSVSPSGPRRTPYSGGASPSPSAPSPRQPVPVIPEGRPTRTGRFTLPPPHPLVSVRGPRGTPYSGGASPSPSAPSPSSASCVSPELGSSAGFSNASSSSSLAASSASSSSSSPSSSSPPSSSSSARSPCGLRRGIAG